MQNFPLKEVFDFFLAVTLWDLAKLAYVTVFFIYILFSVVVLRQIGLMTATLNNQFELPLKLIGVLNLALAIFIFVAALSIL